MNTHQALAFVRLHGIVLQSARGPVPSLAEAIAGEPIRGSWWGHPKGREIFLLSEALTESPEILTCTLVLDKVTFVHLRLWPALVKLAPRFRQGRLAKVTNEHTKSGSHRSRRLAFPKWVPLTVWKQAQRLSEAQAEAVLEPWLAALTEPGRGAG